MLNLIKKDIFLQKKLFVLYAGLILFYIWSDFSPVLTITLTSSMFVLHSHYYDEKDRANVLLNALPYTRKEIISSKYIGALTFTLMLIPTVIIGHFIIDGSFIQLSVKDIVLSLLSVMLFTAFYLPFFYKFTQQYLLIAFSAVFSMLVIIAPRAAEYIVNHFGEIIETITSFSSLQFYGLLSVVVLICYGLSWLLSVKIYQRKAF